MFHNPLPNQMHLENIPSFGILQHLSGLHLAAMCNFLIKHHVRLFVCWSVSLQRQGNYSSNDLIGSLVLTPVNGENGEADCLDDWHSLHHDSVQGAHDAR